MSSKILRPGLDGHFVKGSVVTADYQYPTHNNLEVLKSGHRRKFHIQATNHPAVDLDLDWLPAASETYCISPNPADYVIVAMPIVTVDVPNRNLQSFSREEMAHFASDVGMLVFQTFNRKCCFEGHDNQDPRKAKGVIVDSSMVYLPKYDLWKIQLLTMWDRTKDSKLVQGILDRTKDGYSMGASVMKFSCSVCGREDTMDARRCDHMKQMGSTWGAERRLSSQLCQGTCFFEASNVGKTPADPTAFSDDVFV